MISYFECIIEEGGKLNLANGEVNTIVSYNSETKDIGLTFFYNKDGQLGIEHLPLCFTSPVDINADLISNICMDEPTIAKYRLAGIIE
jgi:hypothetical protein